MWYALCDWRGLVFDGFKYCGIFPICANINSKEFITCDSFQNDKYFQIRQESCSGLQRVLPLPIKKRNATHFSEHVAVATNNEYFTKKQKTAEKKSPKNEEPTTTGDIVES